PLRNHARMPAPARPKCNRRAHATVQATPASRAPWLPEPAANSSVESRQTPVLSREGRTDHQSQVQTQELIERNRKRAKAEKLAAAMQARIVMHADCDHAVRAQLQLAHQLDADCAAGRAEADLVQQLAPDQAKIAIDIAQADTKDQPRELIVSLSDGDAPPRIAALELKSVHQADIRRHLLQQL